MSSGFRSGFIAIIGRPNAGKSTLMNRLIGEKIAIISDKPQTTRNRIQCVLTRPEYQAVFVDTPGINKPKNKLGEYMLQTTRHAFAEMDAILFVVDIAAGIGGGDRHIADMLKELQIPVILVINKIDALDTDIPTAKIAELMEYGGFDAEIRLSAAEGTNVDALEKIILGYLPEGPKYYPDDMITDQPERTIISELIREKALQLLLEEVPHGIGVELEMMKERPDKNIVDIHATILCEKASHKGIVIGKGGKMLREIGSRARQDIEGLLGIQVYLELWVKVKDDWRNDANTLRTLGYDLKK